MARIKPQALLLQSKKKKGPSKISLTTIITSALIVILVVLSVYATYRHWYPRSNDQIFTNIHKFEGLEAVGETYKKDLPGYAEIDEAEQINTTGQMP